MKKKFAYLLMGKQFDPSVHRAVFETGNLVSCIFTVRSFDEAREKVLALAEEGFGVIELCGAFGASGAQKLIELTDNKVAIAYVTHNPDQNPLFDAFFTKS